MRRKLIIQVIAGLALASSLSGVATSFALAADEQSQGAKWVQETEAQKAGLEAQGFTQYAQ